MSHGDLPHAAPAAAAASAASASASVSATAGCKRERSQEKEKDEDGNEEDVSYKKRRLDDLVVTAVTAVTVDVAANEEVETEEERKTFAAVRSRQGGAHCDKCNREECTPCRCAEKRSNCTSLVNAVYILLTHERGSPQLPVAQATPAAAPAGDAAAAAAAPANPAAAESDDSIITFPYWSAVPEHQQTAKFDRQRILCVVEVLMPILHKREVVLLIAAATTFMCCCNEIGWVPPFLYKGCVNNVSQRRGRYLCPVGVTSIGGPEGQMDEFRSSRQAKTDYAVCRCAQFAASPSYAPCSPSYTPDSPTPFWLGYGYAPCSLFPVVDGTDDAAVSYTP